MKTVSAHSDRSKARSAKIYLILKNCELKEDLGETIYDYNTAWESIRYNE